MAMLVRALNRTWSACRQLALIFSQRFAVRLNRHSLWHDSVGAGDLLGKGHALMVQVGQ
jgi:hypothetical protein